MERTPAQRFARRRNATRLCFAIGVMLCLAGRDPRGTLGSASADALLAAGLGLCALTFWLYFRFCNRCPRCNISFSRAPEYQSETDGLALFGRIERCPFCAEPLATPPRGRPVADARSKPASPHDPRR